MTKQCSKHEQIWRQNVLWGQKAMLISQTSLKLAPAWPDVPKRCFRLRARDHIVGTSKLFWYIYRLDIYIVSTYVHTRTLHECSLALAALRAAALARSLLASEARKAVGLSRSLAIRQLSVCVYECIWRHYHYKKYIHGPRKLSPSHVRDNNIVQRAGQQYHSTCGTTISLNVRDNNITQRADDFRSGGFL